MRLCTILRVELCTRELHASVFAAQLYVSRCTHPTELLKRKFSEKRTVQLIIALYSIVSKDEEQTAPKILCKKRSFSTSTDGFRRHGASREAALDSKMLLKAVLIVCVVRKERKAKLCALPREFLFPSQAGGAEALRPAGRGREERLVPFLRESRITLRDGDSHFLARAHMTHLAKSEATCTSH